MNDISQSDYRAFVKEIKEKIYQAQLKALQAVNRELLTLYNEIGRSIVENQEQLGWGKSAVESLAKDLQNEFPGMQGFSSRNLWLMRSFYTLSIRIIKNCSHWLQKLAGLIMLSLWKNVKTFWSGSFISA